MLGKIVSVLVGLMVVFASPAAADIGDSVSDPTIQPRKRGAVERQAAAAERKANPVQRQTGRFPVFQNSLVWVGKPNPNPPPTTVINTFQPLAAVPQFARPAFGWLGDFEFEACALGLSNVTYGQNIVGPYGTSTTAFSRQGC